MDFTQVIMQIPIYFIPFLFSICVHEFAHGWMAKQRGDLTAQYMGRLTLNPMAHADPIGTFVLPIMALAMPGAGIFFGWAKPVPVDERNLKNPKIDMFWIAAAGPLSNILMALIGSFVYVALKPYVGNLGEAEYGQGVFGAFIFLNLSLAFFNMIPIHPLDGGKVIARFIPDAWDQKLQEMQGTLSIVLLLLFLSGAMRVLIYPIVYTGNVFMAIAKTLLM